MARKLSDRSDNFANVFARDIGPNIPFEGLRHLLVQLGFSEGAIIFITKSGVEEILNLQPKDSHAKPYQVKQVRQVILQHKLGGDVNE